MKLLSCPCENAKYCGTMISSMRLHNTMFNSRFRDFIHSRKGLHWLLANYSPNTNIVDAINDAYHIKLR